MTTAETAAGSHAGFFKGFKSCEKATPNPFFADFKMEVEPPYSTTKEIFF
jgi:hypothetical protein